MKITASMLAATLALSTSALACFAQDETTTTTTTTRVESTAVGGSPFALSAGANYVVVDPSSGVALGPLDTTTRLVAGNPIRTGTYIVDPINGRVMATVDTTGSFISYTAVPTVVPANFVVTNGQLIYASGSYALRRSALEQQITYEFANGRLTNRNVKDLRESLAMISSLETKRKGDGTYSSSRMKEIERKFSYVQSELSRDIASTNDKRAKIGIKVN